MPYFVLQRDPARFPFGTEISVHADSVDRTDPTVVRFTRDGRVCYSAPAADVSKLTEHATDLEAKEHLKKIRAWRSGRSSVQVRESGGTAAAPRKRRPGDTGGAPSGTPTEGISIRINET